MKYSLLYPHGDAPPKKKELWEVKCLDPKQKGTEEGAPIDLSLYYSCVWEDAAFCFKVQTASLPSAL